MAQFVSDTYMCDNESFQLLKNLSDSQLGKGDILVFTILIKTCDKLSMD